VFLKKGNFLRRAEICNAVNKLCKTNFKFFLCGILNLLKSKPGIFDHLGNRSQADIRYFQVAMVK
jgi:hypothetical protein